MRRIILALILLLGPATAAFAANGASLISGRFKLQNAASGKTVTQASFDGKYRLIFFGFTYCPIVCPTGLRTLDALLRELGPEAAQVQALFITIDPKRDKAARMREYLKAHDPRIMGLVGSPKAIASAMREFRLEAEKMGEGENYLLEHPGIIYVMGPKGEYLGTLPSSGEAKALLRQFIGMTKKTDKRP